MTDLLPSVSSAILPRPAKRVGSRRKYVRASQPNRTTPIICRPKTTVEREHQRQAGNNGRQQGETKDTRPPWHSWSGMLWTRKARARLYSGRYDGIMYARPT